MTVAEMKAGAHRAIELINAAVAAIGAGGTLLGESAGIAREALSGSTRGDRFDAADLIDRGKSGADDAARHGESAGEAASRWHDAI